MKDLILMLREMKGKTNCSVTHAELCSFLTMFLHVVGDIKDITQAIDELDEDLNSIFGKETNPLPDFPTSLKSTHFPQG